MLTADLMLKMAPTRRILLIANIHFSFFILGRGGVRVSRGKQQNFYHIKSTLVYHDMDGGQLVSFLCRRTKETEAVSKRSIQQHFLITNSKNIVYLQRPESLYIYLSIDTDKK